MVLPEDPDIEELARDWSLTEADIGEVLLCRGTDNCLRFALQLCVLRRFGRFLEEYDDPPVRIVNHLAAQLHLPPVLLLAPPRPATESEYRERLRRYLSVEELDQQGRDRLAGWVSERMADGEAPGVIGSEAEQIVRGWRYALPRKTVFARMIDSFCARAEGDVFERIAAQVPPDGRRRIDELLAVPEGDQRSMLFHLKEYPPNGNAQSINDYMAHYHTAVGTGWELGEIQGVSHNLIEHLYRSAKRHDAWYLKRLPESKRYAMVACFLMETSKTVLDHLIEMNDQHLTKLIGECRRAAQEQQSHYWKLTQDGQDLLVGSMEWMLEQGQSREAWDELLERTPAAELRSACAHYRESRRLERTGYVGVLRERLRWQVHPYLPKFLQLPFQTEEGSPGLQHALATAAVYFRNKKLPAYAPVDFLPPAFRRQLFDREGNMVPEVWELGLAVAVRDAVRARELYLAGSRRYVSFWKMIYTDEQWRREREQVYGLRSVKADCDSFLDRMQRDLDRQAAQTEQGLSENRYAKIRSGRLKLSRDDADPETESAKQLRRIIESHLRQIRIERLLLEVNDLCGFTKQLRPLNEQMPQWENTVAVLIAAVIAHGTNLGIVAMSHSTDGITLEDAPPRQPVVFAAGNVESRQPDTGRFPSQNADQHCLGNGHPLLVGRAEVRRSAGF